MSSTPHPDSIAFHFSVLTDPRMDRTKYHSLHDILVIALCAMLCGAEAFTDFAQFGDCRLPWFKTVLELPHGIPSHDTFRRVFAMLNPREFSNCFRSWTESLRKAVSCEIVAIDGKTLRRSHHKSEGLGPIHMVSAWARENGLVLGQIKVDEKSNEITAIPELIRTLNLAGCIVTIDAMGCQTKIVEAIAEAKADYVIALKGNQGAIHGEVKNFMEAAEANDFGGIVTDILETTERGHGRKETRRYAITSEIEWLTDLSRWENLRSIAMVESVREIQGVVTTERRFFLCSIAANAKELERAVRGHWSIENTLHWCLDVSFNEDQCRTRAGYAAENMALLRHMTMNVLKQDASNKSSIKGRKKIAGWNNAYLVKLLGF